MYTINDLLDLSKTIAAPLFEGKTYPWEVLADISDFIIALGSTLPEEEYEKRGENVWIARDAEVFRRRISARRASSTMVRRFATVLLSEAVP